MKIQALASRYKMRLGENPSLRMASPADVEWWGRNPFNAGLPEGVSDNLLTPPEGTLDGHNTMSDSTIMDSMRVDQNVPISPLFVRDLAGRVIYIGFGPDAKYNVEWADYVPVPDGDGRVKDEDINPFVPVCTFPRFCRDVQRMPGEKLLEQVFLTKFRCMEMSMGYNALPSGALEGLAEGERPDFVAASYPGANLHPYKLRLDTFYIDGYKLPQTQMLYARGENVGVDVGQADRLGEQLLFQWRGRPAGQAYEDWMEKGLGRHEIERLYSLGCTLIPTFESANGFHVVGRDFELKDYWPGRAVLGLHEVMERRANEAPAGTILQVLSPGYVTADRVVRAQVVVSDGSGYVSPNHTDPAPMVPNLYLPHQRTAAVWGATWLPTAPAHFEAPAIWGWDVSTGRFLQLTGPLWDPLHYYYASVDEVLAAFDSHDVSANGMRLVPVPEHMDDRFYPIVQMKGFDTIVSDEYERRSAKGTPLRSCLKRVDTKRVTAGVGYHPLSPEFELELDPFWFPQLHPLNREQDICPLEMEGLLAPVIEPKVSVEAYAATVAGPQDAVWLTNRLVEPDTEPLKTYPYLARYLLADMEINEIMELCPVPFLSDPGDLLTLPPSQWWRTDDGLLDGSRALEQWLPGIAEPLWEMREKGVDVVKFRHMLYRTNLPVYMLGWWYGADIGDLETMLTDWLESLESTPEEEAKPAS